MFKHHGHPIHNPGDGKCRECRSNKSIGQYGTYVAKEKAFLHAKKRGTKKLYALVQILNKYLISFPTGTVYEYLFDDGHETNQNGYLKKK